MLTVRYIVAYLDCSCLTLRNKGNHATSKEERTADLRTIFILVHVSGPDAQAPEGRQ
jgi:hypothetical protein